jgi:hypothetical protein
MKVKLARASGREGWLVIAVVAETEADRVALREFAAPLKGNFEESAAHVSVDRCGPPMEAHLEDLGPSEVRFSLAQDPGAT